MNNLTETFFETMSMSVYNIHASVVYLYLYFFVPDSVSDQTLITYSYTCVYFFLFFYGLQTAKTQPFSGVRSRPPRSRGSLGGRPSISNHISGRGLRLGIVPFDFPLAILSRTLVPYRLATRMCPAHSGAFVLDGQDRGFPVPRRVIYRENRIYTFKAYA